MGIYRQNEHLIHLLRGHHFLACFKLIKQTALYNCFNKNIFTKHKKRKHTDISTLTSLTSKMENRPSSSQEKKIEYTKKKSQLFRRQNLRPHPSAASLDLSSSDAGGVLRKEDMLDPPSPSHFLQEVTITLLGTNIPPEKSILKMFLFPRWDKLVP